MTKYNEIKDTLRLLEEKGFTLCEVDVGEEDVIDAYPLNNALEAIMSTDITTLFVNKDGRNYWIDFARDIGPGMSVGDCSVNPLIDEVVDEIQRKYC